MTQAGDIKKELRRYASEERRKSNEWFFKTGPGEYGEGDKFIGVRVPDTRRVAKQFLEIDLPVVKELLYSKIHEERLLSLLILVEQNKQAIKNENLDKQKQIIKFYLQHSKQVNNWDLVDLSAHYILGQGIVNSLEEESLLDKLSQSGNLWQRRIAIISTWTFIRQGKIDSTLRLSKKLLNDPEDLMHKAVGWMLREAWKLGEDRKSSKGKTTKRKTGSVKKEEKVVAKNEKGQLAQKQVEQFLIKNYSKIPRTALRYAIERMPEKRRKRFLRGEFI